MALKKVDSSEMKKERECRSYILKIRNYINIRMNSNDVNIDQSHKLPSLPSIAERSFKSKEIFNNLSLVFNGSLSYKDLLNKPVRKPKRVFRKKRRKERNTPSFIESEEYKLGKIRINSLAKLAEIGREQYIRNLLQDKATEEDKLYLTRSMLLDKDFIFACRNHRRQFGLGSEELKLEDVRGLMSPASLRFQSNREKSEFDHHSYIKSNISRILHNYTYKYAPKTQSYKILRSMNDPVELFTSQSSASSPSQSKFQSQSKSLQSPGPSKPLKSTKRPKYVPSLNIIQEIKTQHEEVKAIKSRMSHLMIMKDTLKDKILIN
jgi:hypothetical protein